MTDSHAQVGKVVDSRQGDEKETRHECNIEAMEKVARVVNVY